MRSSLNSSWSSSSSHFSNLSVSRSPLSSSSSNPFKSPNTLSRVSLLLPLPLREFYTDYFVSPLQKNEERKIREQDKEVQEEGRLHCQSVARSVSSPNTSQQSPSSIPLNSFHSDHPDTFSSSVSVDNKKELHSSIASLTIDEMSRDEGRRSINTPEREKKLLQLSTGKESSLESLRQDLPPATSAFSSSSTTSLSRRELFDTAVHGIEVLLRPSTRFDDRLAYLHGRSRALTGKLYERFVSIRTKQALKQTLQSGLFRQALAKLAHHIWRSDRERRKDEEEEEDEDRWEGEERNGRGNEKKEGKDDEGEERTAEEDEGLGRREKYGDDPDGEVTSSRSSSSSSTALGIIPSGMVTQMFLFLVNDRVQTCAELAVRWIYTRRKKREAQEEQRRRQKEEMKDTCKPAKKEEENAAYEEDEKGRDEERKIGGNDLRDPQNFSFPSPDEFRQVRSLCLYTAVKTSSLVKEKPLYLQTLVHIYSLSLPSRFNPTKHTYAYI